MLGVKIDYLKLNSSSFEQQHYNRSIIRSDEQNNEHDQSILPIGLPLNHHCLMTLLTITQRPAIHMEQISRNREEQDDMDVVHIRPLNNTFAFN
ncbi:unnamed protein product [Rotaria sp. Silwood1]|nr:unnamed protein product [Rotaria sp. Silwood1]CAF3457218.1 unnamed protein product [Rotaria sp. Silwood1]CAF3462948.1 unnamed protein product [Rotaria sp. Silwood1]CAF4672513.1 unnamed protein product [Rotaria sp. Silwood1]CAF4849681.1 unnamed protein product [Rotaria sp. Silwood1]